MVRFLLIFLSIVGVIMGSSLPQHFSFKLENGLEVVVIPMKNGSNVITTEIFYKVGSGDEIMGKSGIAHMLEHLNFKSTKNLESGEFDEIVKGFGGVNNASTGFDYTTYFIKSSSKNLSKNLELFSELMQNVNLLDNEFQPERDVVLEERLWRTDNSPIGFLYFNLFNNAYVYHPYHWTPIGFKDDIKNWKIEDIKSFHEKYYQPNNAILVVAGDITPATVFSEVKKYFEHIPSKEITRNEYMQEPEQTGAKRVYLTKDSDVEMIAIAYKIPAFDHEDQVALSALSSLLSSGKSSRLYNKLIQDKKMANQLYAYNMDLKNPGLFLFLAVANPNINAEDIEKEILSTIDELKTSLISESELKKIKTNTKADFIYSLESSAEVSSLYGSFLARGNLSPLLEYEQKIETLTEKEIKDVANKYFDQKTSTTVILRKEQI